MSVHEVVYAFIASFMALFPVIDPVGSGLIIDGFLGNMDREERKSANKKIIMNSMAIIIVCMVAGHLILLLFGLAIPVVQVAGGIIISKTGWDWLSESKSSEIPKDEKPARKMNLKDIGDKLFYPISFPLTIGPGSISVIFALMANTSSIKGNLLKTWINYAAIAIAIIAILAILYAYLVHGHKIIKKLGPSAGGIINKIIAFLTFCIGLQIIFTGIGKVFNISILP